MVYKSVFFLFEYEPDILNNNVMYFICDIFMYKNMLIIDIKGVTSRSFGRGEEIRMFL